MIGSAKPFKRWTKQAVIALKKRKQNQRIADQQAIIKKLDSKIPQKFQISNFSSSKLKPVSLTEFHNIRPNLIEALKLQQITTPTPIQSRACSTIPQHRQVILASETGSGKTLAYLLPLISIMKDVEDAESRSQVKKAPKLVVLVPSRELVDQVAKVCKSLVSMEKFKCDSVLQGMSLKDIKTRIDTNIDVLITVPTRLLQLEKENGLRLDSVKYLALDEADTLFDSDFSKDLLEIIQKMKYEKLVAACATVTKPSERFIQKFLPDAVKVSMNLHKPVDKLKQRFFPVSSPISRKTKCLQLLKSISTQALIFCNTLKSATELHEFLSENADCHILHSRMPAGGRSSILQSFKEKKFRFLITTDLLARGVDFDIPHVVLYEFPRNPADYIHRIGRTARCGRGGKVSCLVAKRDEPLAKFIQMANFSNKAFSEFKVLEFKNSKDNKKRK